MELKLETNQSRVGLREAVEGGREKGWEGEIWWKRETEVAGGEAAAGARPPPLSLFCDRSGPGGAAGVRVRPSRRAHAEAGGGGRLGYVPSDRDGSVGINIWMGTLPFGFSRTDHGRCNARTVRASSRA